MFSPHLEFQLKKKIPVQSFLFFFYIINYVCFIHALFKQKNIW